jgi:hypothetical protein
MMNCGSMMINGSLKAQLSMYGFPFVTFISAMYLHQTHVLHETKASSQA